MAPPPRRTRAQRSTHRHGVAHRLLFVPCTGVHGPAHHVAGAYAKPPGVLLGGATWRAAVAARRCGRRDARCGGQCAPPQSAHTTVGACARSSARTERAIGSAWSGAARVHWRRYRRRSPPPRVAAAAHHVRSTDARQTWSSRRYVQICTFVAKPYRSQVRRGCSRRTSRPSGSGFVVRSALSARSALRSPFPKSCSCSSCSPVGL